MYMYLTFSSTFVSLVHQTPPTAVGGVWHARLCIYHTLVPEIRVCPEMLHVFHYIDMLICVIYN